MVIGVYYRPVGIYLVYFSPYYGLTYYDGYGWNFYTNLGGYYDGAPLPGYAYGGPRTHRSSSSGGGAVVAVIVVIIVILICACIFYFIWNAK